MKLIYALIIVALISIPALGQQPAGPKEEPPVAAAPSEQQEFERAAAAAQTAQTEASAAQARLEAAQARVQSAILRALAKLKLDPDEYDARLVEGRLVFTKKQQKKEGP